MTEDIDKWRKYVHGVANPRTEDGKRTEQNSRDWDTACGFESRLLFITVYVRLSQFQIKQYITIQ